MSESGVRWDAAQICALVLYFNAPVAVAPTGVSPRALIGYQLIYPKLVIDLPMNSLIWPLSQRRSGYLLICSPVITERDPHSY